MAKADGFMTFKNVRDQHLGSSFLLNKVKKEFTLGHLFCSVNMKMQQPTSSNEEKFVFLVLHQ